jgi:hypothetical protein
MSIVEDDTGLLREEISVNAVPIEEAWEVSLEEYIRIFDNREEDALSTSDMQEGMKFFPYMKRMEWCGRKRELVNHVGKNIVEGRIVTCDPKEPILDDDIGETDVGVTILNCLKDKSLIMSIWKWPLS